MKIHLYGASESSAATNDPATPRPINTAGRRQQAAQIPSDARTAPTVANFALPRPLLGGFAQPRLGVAAVDGLSASTLMRRNRRSSEDSTLLVALRACL